MENVKTGIIFDLDGTILNTLDDLADSVNYVLNFYNYPLRSKDEVRSFVGNGIKLLMERALPKNIDKSIFDECFDLFKTHYANNLQNKTAPYEGILDLLKILKGNDVLMGIVSNKFQIGVDNLIENFFKDYITVGIGNQEGLRTKPAPDSVFLALNKLGLNNDLDTIYYVGDSDVDIFTARNANLPVISVTWGFRTKEELIPLKPDFIVDNPFQILDILHIKRTL